MRCSRELCSEQQLFLTTGMSVDHGSRTRRRDKGRDQRMRFLDGCVRLGHIKRREEERMITKFDDTSLAIFANTTHREPRILELSPKAPVEPVAAPERLDGFQHPVTGGYEGTRSEPHRVVLSSKRARQGADGEVLRIRIELPMTGASEPEDVPHVLNDHVLEPSSGSHQWDTSLPRKTDDVNSCVRTLVVTRAEKETRVPTESLVGSALGLGSRQPPHRHSSVNERQRLDNLFAVPPDRFADHCDQATPPSRSAQRLLPLTRRKRAQRASAGCCGELCRTAQRRIVKCRMTITAAPNLP